MSQLIAIKIVKGWFPISTCGNQPILASENISDTKEKQMVICILLLTSLLDSLSWCLFYDSRTFF